MKRLCISLSIILLLSAAAGWHVVQLSQFVGELTGLLEEASAALDREDWDAAQALTRQALDRWQGRDAYLHNTLRHTDVDAVLISFQEVLAYLDSREHSAACAAAAARLITQLELLVEAELPTLTNLL